MRKFEARMCVVCIGVLSLSPLAVFSQTTESSRVIDAAGLRSTSAQFINFSAVGQGVPVGFNSNATRLNYSGFLQTFLMFPLLDTDKDNVPDENDPDDDNDTLSDATELAGSSFNPTTPTNPLLADSDCDGASDPDESVAGTNPTNSNARFRVVAITLGGGDTTIRWTSRGGKTYQVFQSATMPGLLSAAVPVDTELAVGGVAPWFETETQTTIPSLVGPEFERVKVLP